MIRKFIRAVISEAMATPQVAQKAGLALAFVDDGDEHYAVLYDRGATAQQLEDASHNPQFQFRDEAPEVIVQNVKAMTMFSSSVTGEAEGAWEIRRSAAEKGSGYGPLMYYITMAHVPTHTIMSDRQDVSGDAGGVWSKFASGGGGVEALKLDDEEDPKTEPTKDDSKLVKDPKRPYLDYAYRQKSGGTQTGQLEAAHDEFVGDIGFSIDGVTEADVSAAIRAAAKKYFESKYS